MTHGTDDGITTWCGTIVESVGGWDRDAEAVECIECLRRKIRHTKSDLVKAHNETLRYITDASMRK